ncbi:hypothetical protein [Ammoniphilus sp. CFH 90114]|uniref:hypothetical protein n=1 Tax=Ammoniphilus sp. CFH 90114 TaxID=2493665 RepID=UPI00100DA826|nr:hypothetical protein [Ammoniphilus sp. CFH 90114]RXT07115.1 hypothetical protein EIZ39_13280 [Ammoniphilus sp. CFH 90114]
MEWDLIWQLDVEHLSFTLSLILGTVTLSVIIELRLCSNVLRFFQVKVKFICNKINPTWLTQPITYPSKLFILLHRLLVANEEQHILLGFPPRN